MNRKEIYAEIKKQNLADAVKKAFGKNFTQVGNADLEKFLNKNTTKNTVKPKAVKPNTKSACKAIDYKANYERLLVAVGNLLAALPKDLAHAAVNAASKTTNVQEVVFTEDDIEALFNF